MTDFEEIYNQYFRDVYRYCLSLCRNESTAEEITQETFFKALKGIESFEGRCSLYVWLCQIAKNTYFSHLKTEKRLHPDQEPDVFPSPDSLEEQLIDKDAAFRIHQQLHALPEPYKEVFSLRLFGQLPFAQIGLLFGKTESWARVIYHRARLKIKEELK